MYTNKARRGKRRGARQKPTRLNRQKMCSPIEFGRPEMLHEPTSIVVLPSSISPEALERLSALISPEDLRAHRARLVESIMEDIGRFGDMLKFTESEQAGFEVAGCEAMLERMRDLVESLERKAANLLAAPTEKQS